MIYLDVNIGKNEQKFGPKCQRVPMKFKAILKELEQLGEEIYFYGVNSIANINIVEQKLGFTIDENYKKFILEYGGGGIVGIISINGILPADKFSMNIFTLYGATLYAREKFNLPPEYAVITSDFPEKCWIIETNNTHENEILRFDTLSSMVGHTIYKNFNDFLISEFNEFLEELKMDL